MWDHDDCRGSVWAWRELNRRVAADLERGEGDIRPVVKLDRANPARVAIGLAKRRLIRGEFDRFKRGA